MPVGDALILLEGPHDAEFVAQLLKAANYQRVTEKTKLPTDWQPLVNPNFPKTGRGINLPHEVPQFRALATGELVTLVIAGGDSKLSSALEASVLALRRLPSAIGFVLDDDRQPSPVQRHKALLALLKPKLVSPPLGDLIFPEAPGDVRFGPPRTGVFVLPDNLNAGTLEDVILQAAAASYPTLLRQASEFVRDLDEDGLTPDDLKERRKPAGRKKEVVGVCSSILKPGRALATSLQDNRWLAPEALAVPLVNGFRVWLHGLLDLPRPV